MSVLDFRAESLKSVPRDWTGHVPIKVTPCFLYLFMSARSTDNKPETSTKGEKPLQRLHHNTFGKAGDGNGVLPCIQSQLK